MKQTVKQDLFVKMGEKVIEMGQVMDAQVQKNRAIMRAADHADRASDGWSDRALGFVLAVAASHRVFTSEDVRVYAHDRGLTVPPDARAWGYVLQNARKLGYVRPAGFTVSRFTHAHQRPVRRWEAI